MALRIAWSLQRAMGFRIKEEAEMTGIDQVVHAESGYDLHVTPESVIRPSADATVR